MRVVELGVGLLEEGYPHLARVLAVSEERLAWVRVRARVRARVRVRVRGEGEGEGEGEG